MKMKKIFYFNRSKRRKSKNSKISYIFEAILVLSIIFDKCGKKDEKNF